MYYFVYYVGFQEVLGGFMLTNYRHQKIDQFNKILESVDWAKVITTFSICLVNYCQIDLCMFTFTSNKLRLLFKKTLQKLIQFNFTNVTDFYECSV